MRPLLHLLALLLSISCIAQKKPIVIRDTVEIAVVSKVSADSVQKEYIEILKSTNEQLNNYWTPVNWFLGALGVLVAIGGVVAGYLLWRQSRDFKEDRKKLFSNIKAAAASEIDKVKTLRRELISIRSESSIAPSKIDDVLKTFSKLWPDEDDFVSKYRCKECNNEEDFSYKFTDGFKSEVNAPCSICNRNTDFKFIGY